MQEHVELEVSLEVIMAEIAEEMHKLALLNKNKKNNFDSIEKLNKLIYLQEEAYKGNRKVVSQILNREFN